MTETQSRMAKAELGSVEAADAAFAYAAQMEAIISDLHTASRQTYGQYCGLARALEIVGERWALLIVRDLLVGPRSFMDLHRGLPRVPVNVLSSRLEELERAGIVQGTYELTDLGRGLEDIVLGL